MSLIVLLCRNNVMLSRSCLLTLLAQSTPVSILAVDNASSDTTPKYLASMQARHPNIFRTTYQRVVSVSQAWNDALYWAWTAGHREALVVNNDTELLMNTYKLLLEFMGNNKGLVTAVSVDSNPTYPETITSSPHPDYSCFMIRDTAHQLVPFDEHYQGAYLEDLDHHIRMYRAKIWAGSINLGFLHHRSSTLLHATPEERARIHHNQQRNRERFYKQYGCTPEGRRYEALFKEAA